MSQKARTFSCKNDPDLFCYVCGQYITGKKRKWFLTSLQKSYQDCYNIYPHNLNQHWTPGTICIPCRLNLSMKSSNVKRHLEILKPMLWRETANHASECYFCLSTKSIFDGPQIRKLVNDTEFGSSMSEIEKNAWDSFVWVIQNFLGNNKGDDYVAHVEEMLTHFQNLGCNMSIKLHYLHSHLDRFPENLGDLSEEQGERFHQDIRTMEERYQGRWDAHMMADFCWSIQSNTSLFNNSRKSTKRKFQSL